MLPIIGRSEKASAFIYLSVRNVVHKGKSKTVNATKKYNKTLKVSKYHIKCTKWKKNYKKISTKYRESRY